MTTQISIDRDAIIALMSAAIGSSDASVTAAWMECWQALATTPQEAIAATEEIIRSKRATALTTPEATPPDVPSIHVDDIGEPVPAWANYCDAYCPNWRESLRRIDRTQRQQPMRQFDVREFADKIPAEARWVAMDERGQVWPYAEKPTEMWNESYPRNRSDIFHSYIGYIARIDPTGIDWTQTLTPVNQKWWERVGEETVTAAELERQHGCIVPVWAEWVVADSYGIMATEDCPHGEGFRWENYRRRTAISVVPNLGDTDWRTTKRRIIR